MDKNDFEKVLQFALNNYKLGDLHGLPHWRRVARNGIMMLTEANIMTEANYSIVQTFAYLHDVCRESDLKDPFHGQRAAQLIQIVRESLLSGLGDNDMILLVEACKNHTNIERTGNIIIDTCFDADRLDLPRCGITPNPYRMATTQGEFYANNMGILNQRIREYEVL